MPANKGGRQRAGLTPARCPPHEQLSAPPRLRPRCLRALQVLPLLRSRLKGFKDDIMLFNTGWVGLGAMDEPKSTVQRQACRASSLFNVLLLPRRRPRCLVHSFMPAPVLRWCRPQAAL